MSASFFRVLSYGDQVGDGDNCAVFCTLEGIAKLGHGGHPHLAANEYLSFRLGQVIGLPTVPGVVVEDQAGLKGYVSLRFGPRKESPPPILPDEFVAKHPSLSAGTIVFDCWIANNDRHDGNLAMTGDDVYLFDHDLALLGKGREATPAGHMLSKHCLCEALTDGAALVDWVQVITGVATRVIEGIVNEVVQQNALAPADGRRAVELLTQRRDDLRTMLSAAQADHVFTRIRQQSLFLAT